MLVWGGGPLKIQATRASTASVQKSVRYLRLRLRREGRIFNGSAQLFEFDKYEKDVILNAHEREVSHGN